MVTVIATTLKNKRDLLKTTIQNKFNTTCTSTTIKELLNELNNLVPTATTSTLSFTSSDTVSSKINKTATYLVNILSSNGVIASVDDGFTTLIGKISNIVIIDTSTASTPTITLSRNSSSVSSGSSVTLTATVKGDALNGTPSGKVEFYENGDLLATVTSGTADGNNRKYTRSVSHSVSSTTSYTYTAKFISTDTERYKDSAVSSSVSVSWTYTAPTPSKQNSTVSISATPSPTVYGNYITISASGKGTVNIGTTNGGSEIATGTESASGRYWVRTVGEITFYATSSGDSNYYGASNSVKVTVNKAENDGISLSVNPTSIQLGASTSWTAYGMGNLKIGTSSGASDIGSKTATSNTSSTTASGTYTPSSRGTKTLYLTAEGNANYNSGTTTASVTVTKANTNLTTSQNKISKGGSFKLYLKDSSGNALVGYTINGSLSAKTYTNTVVATTDYEGCITLGPYNYDWDTTTFTYKLSFAGNDDYNGTGEKTFTATYN